MTPARPRSQRHPQRYPRAAVLLLLLCLAACAAERVAIRPHDPAALAGLLAAWRFEREPLAAVPGVAPERAAEDTLLRAALSAALASRGYVAAPPGAPAGLLLDYTLAAHLTANEKRLDSPSDYLRSWRDPGISQDGSGSMDHAVADAAFAGELSLVVLLRTADTRALLWEGSVTRTLPSDATLNGALGRALERMSGRLAAGLPRR